MYFKSLRVLKYKGHFPFGKCPLCVRGTTGNRTGDTRIFTPKTSVFVDPVRKLEAYLQTRKSEPDYDEDEPIFITVSEAAQITGRNRKTITDWNRKGLLANGGLGKIKRIDVEKTIEKLKNSVKISR